MKVHKELSGNVGECGFLGKTTKDNAKVTCKFCLKMIKENKT